MKTKDLDKKLDKWLKKLPTGDRQILLAHLSGLKSVYPFNEYEHRLMHLVSNGVISLEEYENLRKSYVESNVYLHLYGIAPRIFGAVWAEKHLTEIDPRFKKASKTIDEKFSGEYDLYIERGSQIIKVEVKASRAINKNVRGGLETKALASNAKEPFWMNFQQLKLGMADVFIFIGVWVDQILYWVLPNEEVKRHPGRSHQHRGGKEYQIGITNENINEFKKFLVEPTQLVNVILKKTMS